MARPFGWSAAADRRWAVGHRPRSNTRDIAPPSSWLESKQPGSAGHQVRLLQHEASLVDIHPTASVHAGAKLGRQVTIGPFAVIEADVEIGDRCRIASHVVIKSGTKLGRDNRVDTGAVLGGRPQHLAAGDSVGRLSIGDGNEIRELVTAHVALDVGEETSIGDRNLIMVSAHVGHDCVIGHHNIIANNVMLAGHVVVGDRAYLSGAVGVHQFCRIGSFAMVGGQAHVTRDVPPYVTVDGASTCLVGLNSIGLRRAGMAPEQLQELKAAYRIAFRSGCSFDQRLAQLRKEYGDGPAKLLHDFLATGQRGFLQDRRGPSDGELRVRWSRASKQPNRNVEKAA